MKDRDKLTTRRSVLKAAGASSIVALAGCGGDGGDGGSDGGDGGSDGGDGGSDGGDGGSDDTATETGSGPEDFPNKELTVLIGSAPGGGFDAYGRMTARWMEEKYVDVSVVPENVGGAEGVIAMEQIDNRLGWDDHTMGLWNTKDLIQNQLVQDVNYDMRDLTWYPRITVDDDVIAIAERTGITEWQPFVDAMQNEELTIAATGGRSGALILIGEITGLWSSDLVFRNTVSYAGKPEMIQAVQAGDVDVMESAIGSLFEWIESDLLHAMLTLSTEDEPDDRVPNANTFATIGLDSSTAETLSGATALHRGFAGPPNVPDERANWLREKLTQTIQDQDLIDQANSIERPIVYADSEEMRNIVENTITFWENNPDLLQKLFE